MARVRGGSDQVSESISWEKVNSKCLKNFARIYNLNGLFNHGSFCQTKVLLCSGCRRIHLKILYLIVSGFELGDYLKLTNCTTYLYFNAGIGYISILSMVWLGGSTFIVLWSFIHRGWFPLIIMVVFLIYGFELFYGAIEIFNSNMGRWIVHTFVCILTIYIYGLVSFGRHF